MTPQASTPSDNPFPAEAVAIYGSKQITCENLQYMIRLSGELTQYLTAYARDDARYGAAIGLRGAHGAGKTHILAWLADAAKQWHTIRSTVLYGKCDSSTFFDLYQELAKVLERDAFIEIVQLALLNLARAKVRAVRVTESLADRLETAGALQQLQSEQNLDLVQLRQQLVEELRAGGAPEEVARIILAVPDPITGLDAHRWLTGNDVASLEPLGVAYQLRSMPREIAIGATSGERDQNSTAIPMSTAREDRAIVDTGAITALSAIATLHRIAGVPLIVLVDQLEVLLRVPDGPAFDTITSLLKKFIEELDSRAVLLFIAGVPEPWKRLPRDVPARFRGRAETVVGGLTLQEAQVFLESYTSEGKMASLTAKTVERIHELAGGSPREMLRIAYHVFDGVAGNLGAVADELVLTGARLSGTVADRAAMALNTLDAVLPEFGGKTARELAVPGGEVIDRALLSETGELVAAFAIVKATDALAEISSARRLQSVRRYFHEKWPRAELIVVAVGYSTAEVRELLGSGVVVILFNEKTFEAELRMQLLASVKEKDAAAAAATTNEDPQLTQRLAQIADRLRELEASRTEGMERVQTRFREGAAVLSRPAIEERKLTTRREVLDALEDLREQLISGESLAEQKIVRSILVANEAHLHNSILDELGEVYLEAIAIERIGPSDTVFLRTERQRLIYDMIECVRRPSALMAAAHNQMQGWLALMIAFAAFVFSAIFSTATRSPGPRVLFLSYPVDWATTAPFICLLLVFAAVLYICVVRAAGLRQRRSLRQRLDYLRRRADVEVANKDLIRQSYPQAR